MRGTLPDPEAVVHSKDLLREPYPEKFFEGQARPLRVGDDVVPTMLPTWNKYCRDEGGGLGLAMGWHLILAGNTGYGKSLAALNLASSAMKAGVSVGFVSLEMSSAQVTCRLYSILTGVPVRFLERGPSFSEERAGEARRRLTELRQRASSVDSSGEATDRVRRKLEEARKGPPGGSFFVNDERKRPLHDINDILSLMAYWREEKGVRFFVVDYMQLAGSGTADEVRERVTQVSRGVRLFARTHKVVTVGVSQFNRLTSANYQEKPTVQGLFGASGLENDGNQVVLLDHSRYKRTEEGARTWLLLSKNRHGSTGQIPVYWDYSTLTVREAMPDEEHEWPGYRDSDGRDRRAA